MQTHMHLRPNFLQLRSLLYLFFALFFLGNIPFLSIAFLDYSYDGILHSTFAGFDNFRPIFNGTMSPVILWNTLWLGTVRILLLLTFSLISAYFISKYWHSWLMPALLIVALLPNFFSSPATAAIFKTLFAHDGIIVTVFAMDANHTVFFTSAPYFYIVVFLYILWQSSGLYILLATLAFTSIDSNYYDFIRLHSSRNKTLNSIAYVLLPFSRGYLFTTLVLLALGFFSGVFEPIYTMYNPALYDRVDTVSTYALRTFLSTSQPELPFALTLLENMALLLLLAPLVRTTFQRVDGWGTRSKENHHRFVPTRITILSRVFVPLFVVFFLAPILLTIPWRIAPLLVPLHDPNFVHALWVSIKVTSMGTALSLILIYSSAYIFSHISARETSVFFHTLMFAVVFNGGVLGLYMVLKWLGLINTLYALILPYLFSPFYFYYAFFRIKDYPASVIYSTKLHTGSHVKMLLKVLVPMDKKFIMALGVLLFFSHWNNWLPNIIFTHSEDLVTAQLYILNVFRGGGSILGMGDILSTQEQMAYVYISLLPALALFPFTYGIFRIWKNIPKQ